MARSTVFMNNKSQAVRLPKPVALPDDVKKVDIVKVGRARLITPAGESWDAWFGETSTTQKAWLLAWMSLPFDYQAAAHLGQVRAELQKSGKPIGPSDLMIAGHARSA